ncbi:MAG: tRNA uridine-5-carboxymethylaminomethyl(34) synthesis GTPase MnmE [Deltaproteobacteria bacterium]|jgi:tRNA modification GTPase|nr:tRNA uridine-5-carboxymethylaminomethyl(34) synthesis GTPase MnmE [Deltaproteobacteria bacterium]MCL5879261.1 tRNA uridine-5-carboxymethylaminomethyl(34) synthesis GTPase MnmE [Deltaproteobacteria bacterium]MDA8304956.1 tRNA uridine-5-carboxymethylaminomethyl(34) synthesis GTPase MnmE [Deltaproteobacteria bacterium]
MAVKSSLFKEIDTICAISSPAGEGAISIIRASGADSITILEKIFKPYGKNAYPFKPRYFYAGRIYDPFIGSFVDEAACIYIKGPDSYTGEDMFEIYPHGGIFNTRHILEIILKSGARLAYNGEFTKRAYLNNKINLIQAEAILEIIKANSVKTLLIANNELNGLLEKRIKTIKDGYLYLLAAVEALIDFPEEEFNDLDSGFLNAGYELAGLIKDLINSYENYNLNRQGLSVVIAGKPNAGKSSLLNALLEKNRAIVSDVPGTTRDYIEDNLFLFNKPIKVVDTAGLRESRDLIESEGIKLTYRQIEKADIVIYIYDAQDDFTDFNFSAGYEMLKRKNVIFVLNKIDLLPAGDLTNKKDELFKKAAGNFESPEIVLMSVKNNIGIDLLKDALYDIILKIESGVKEDVGITTIRQKALLEKSYDLLQKGRMKYKDKEPLELISIDLRDAISYLDEIIGGVTNEDILDKLFKEFCIGK